MVTGDDGEEPRYEDLNDQSKQLVDAMRRFEHARATGDHNALALAEHDLEELGRVVVWGSQRPSDPPFFAWQMASDVEKA